MLTENSIFLATLSFGLFGDDLVFALVLKCKAVGLVPRKFWSFCPTSLIEDQGSGRPILWPCEVLVVTRIHPIAQSYHGPMMLSAIYPVVRIYFANICYITQRLLCHPWRGLFQNCQLQHLMTADVAFICKVDSPSYARKGDGLYHEQLFHFDWWWHGSFFTEFCSRDQVTKSFAVSWLSSGMSIAVCLSQPGAVSQCWSLYIAVSRGNCTTSDDGQVDYDAPTNHGSTDGRAKMVIAWR